MDHFAEYLVQKRPTSQDRLKQGLIVAAAVVLSVLIGAISVLTGWLFLLVLVLRKLAVHFLWNLPKVNLEG